jgi:hypothetical protein
MTHILEKLGWKRGEGLGLNSDGIARPLVLHKKQDLVGIGGTKEPEWWDSCFNKAAKSLVIVQTDNACSVAVRSVEEMDYSVKVSDSELLKACGGIVPTTGARRGVVIKKSKDKKESKDKSKDKKKSKDKSKDKSRSKKKSKEKSRSKKESNSKAKSKDRE